MYRTANEKMNILICNARDFVPDFTLYSNEDGNVILDDENKYYKHYLKFTESYMQADVQHREKIKSRLNSKEMKKAVKQLDSALEVRRKQKELFILGQHTLPDDDAMNVIDWLVDKRRKEHNFGGEVFTTLVTAYTYGVIQGKREERRRRANNKTKSLAMTGGAIYE